MLVNFAALILLTFKKQKEYGEGKRQYIHQYREYLPDH
jgi:hypothetical protein